jgi:copper transporter 1
MDYDHNAMDHSQMDHGDHAGHGGHGDMSNQCNMNMLFTWDTNNLCIVFRQWHINSIPSLLFSLVAIVFIATGYEGLRALSKKYELDVAKRLETIPSKSTFPHLQSAIAEGVLLGEAPEAYTETTSLMGAGQNQEQAEQRAHIIRGLLYAFQNFYAFMLM